MFLDESKKCLSSCDTLKGLFKVHDGTLQCLTCGQNCN